LDTHAIRLTWLGQASFLIEREGLRVLIDPFFADHAQRLYPPPPIEDYATCINVVLITHEHVDHLDRPFLAQLIKSCPDVRIVVPEGVATLLTSTMSADVLAPMAPGDEIKLAPRMTVRAVPAFHSLEAHDPYSDGTTASGGARFLGYILQFDGLTAYHSGDTVVTDDLLAALARTPIDVALLPINGRDFFREQREIVGNMTAREAVHLAAHLGVRALVPMHWDLFRGNTERPAAVLDEATAIGAPFHVITLARQVPFEFR
jgi:L-ascorbate 6-phosphate lactonase